MDAFFEPLDDNRFRATQHTGGPWDPRFQHAGPPSALLARAIERESPAWPATVTRVTVEILGSIPLGELELRSSVLRPGRSVDLVGAELLADGRPVAQARGWRIRRTELDLPELPVSHDDPAVDAVPPLPEDPLDLPPGWGGGYLHAMQWRAAAGAWAQPGPATIWGRMRFPLVAGEQPTGLQRTMAIADSGNGISSVLPMGKWMFINTELTVHVAAAAEGEWICLDARTRVDRAGFGLASSRLFDRRRLVGRGAQALFVAQI